MRYLIPLLFAPLLWGAELKVQVSWGHGSAKAAAYYVRLQPLSQGVEVRSPEGDSLESGDEVREGAFQTTAGAGDVDGMRFSLVYPETPERRLENLQVIWRDLIAQSDPDTALRLMRDPAFRTNPRKLGVWLNPEGTRGFAVSVDQLLRERAIWVPSLDVYITAGDKPVPFDEHRRELAAWKGSRILDRLHAEPEATYAQYTARWEDMGSPSYVHPNQPAPGHIVGLTWDSAIPKFGIDRGAGVWNDYGNPDHFRFWFGFGDLTQGMVDAWKGQALADGLPILTTTFEKEGVRYQVEQFAYPLDGPPAERRGDIAMVLLQKVRITNLTSSARTVPVSMAQRREFSGYDPGTVTAERRGASVMFRGMARQQVLLAVEGLEGEFQWNGTHDYQQRQKRLDATVWVDLPAGGSRELTVKLPSPAAPPEKAAALGAIDYGQARAQTERFWADYVERGAQFRVPEKVVNDLFRATLWHALRLPRRHGGTGSEVAIDLPYSNFAYSQTGTPWPVNQAVYVDYMLYDLRGYHGISTEELLAQYRNNQEADGHVAGLANWVVYTPGMLYAVGQNYLLTRDKEALQRMLSPSLKALDWCLKELRQAAAQTGPARGLVVGPLNDLTGNGVWAFNQAYLYAGLERFGRALEIAGLPRASEALEAARRIRESVARDFGAASAASTLVQLRDHTWTPYVPCEVLTPRRLLEQWYPADVDTGAVHLIRLKAVDPGGEISDALLNDHEDNLFLHGWGVANEPVYNQHATAYLLRDDPKAAIRAFYSYMASAFSHSALEPVEHRWTHGQYFGPPSTDGAWFELYRNMLLREMDDETLVVAEAAPRRWLANGQKIEVERAPTYFGAVSYSIESRTGSGQISATVEFTGQRRPRTLLVRFRHPDSKPIRSVTVDGKPSQDFDRNKEWVRIPSPGAKQVVVASYE